VDKACKYLFGIGMIVLVAVQIAAPGWRDDSKGDKRTAACEGVKAESVSNDVEANNRTKLKPFSATTATDLDQLKLNRAKSANGPEDHPVHFVIYLYSTAELLLTDAQVRRTGYDPVSGQTFEEIPHATYGVEVDYGEKTDESLDETKVLDVMDPGAGQFSLQVCGTANGTYGMEILIVNKHLIVSGTSYENVSIAPNQIDTYRIRYDNTLENYEAETMALANYATESNPDTASGETLVKVSPLAPSGPATGNASFTYTGSSGLKDIAVWFYDTTNGKAAFKLYVNDVQKDEWVADQNLDSSFTIASRSHRVLNNILINSGDRIRIEGTAESNEYAFLDNVEVSPVLWVQSQGSPADR
jgi:hypothetical protein